MGDVNKLETWLIGMGGLVLVAFVVSWFWIDTKFDSLGSDLDGKIEIVRKEIGASRDATAAQFESMNSRFDGNLGRISNRLDSIVVSVGGK